jgi:hypothetical protein
MARDYKVVCLSEALSPISHAKGVAGNISLVNTEAVPTARGVAEVPILSANAIRHRAVRSPGARWLVEEYGLRGTLTLPLLNFLLHGGSLTEGGGREDTRRIADFQRIFPLGRLLGGSLPSQILAGSMHCLRGTLACEESRAVLEHDAPAAMAGVGRLRPMSSFVAGWQYTRSDARKTHPDLCPPGDGDDDSNLMIFSGQCVMRGSLWLHGFVLLRCSDLELGALLWSLALWQSAGGTIGGQAARGHGRLRTEVLAGDWDGPAAVAAYLDHARSVRDEAVAWLHDAFSPKAPAVSKGRKKEAPSP